VRIICCWMTLQQFLCYCVIFICFLSVYEISCRKLTNYMAQEPEGSSPHSQQIATGPYFEPFESNRRPPPNLPKIHSDPILPSTLWSSEWSLSFGLSHQNLVHFSLLSRALFRIIALVWLPCIILLKYKCAL
jgi:hypothetical protein